MHKTIIRCSVLIAASGALASQAAAYFATGGQFTQMCQRDQVSAQAYAAGVVDGFIARRAGSEVPSIACLPDDVRLAQIRAIACAFVEGNPSQHELPASYLIIAALDYKWPCDTEQ